MIIWGSMGRPKVQNKKIFGAAEALILAKIGGVTTSSIFRKKVYFPYIVYGIYRGPLYIPYLYYKYISLSLYILFYFFFRRGNRSGNSKKKKA